MGCVPDPAGGHGCGGVHPWSVPGCRIGRERADSSTVWRDRLGVGQAAEHRVSASVIPGCPESEAALGRRVLTQATYTAGPGYWFASQAVEWIAYGSSPVEMPRPHPVWGYNPPAEIMAALEARANGQIWRPIAPPYGDFSWQARARARRIMRDMRMTAAEALGTLKNAPALAAHETMQLKQALAKLNQAVASGDYRAEGRPSESHIRPKAHRKYERISRRLFDGLRSIQADNWFCIGHDQSWEFIHDPGPFYYDVRVRTDDVRQSVTNLEPPPPAPDYRTGAAGRPSSRYLVEAEMKRRAEAGVLRREALETEVRELATWLKETHPSCPPMTLKTIGNVLRDLYRELTKSPK